MWEGPGTASDLVDARAGQDGVVVVGAEGDQALGVGEGVHLVLQVQVREPVHVDLPDKHTRGRSASAGGFDPKHKMPQPVPHLWSTQQDCHPVSPGSILWFGSYLGLQDHHHAVAPELDRLDLAPEAQLPDAAVLIVVPDHDLRRREQSQGEWGRGSPSFHPLAA